MLEDEKKNEKENWEKEKRPLANYLERWVEKKKKKGWWEAVESCPPFGCGKHPLVICGWGC